MYMLGAHVTSEFDLNVFVEGDCDYIVFEKMYTESNVISFIKVFCFCDVSNLKCLDLFYFFFKRHLVFMWYDHNRTFLLDSV